MPYIEVINGSFPITILARILEMLEPMGAHGAILVRRGNREMAVKKFSIMNTTCQNMIEMKLNYQTVDHNSID